MSAVSWRTRGTAVTLLEVQPVPERTASVPASLRCGEVKVQKTGLHFALKNEHRTFSNNSSRWSFKDSSINKRFLCKKKKNFCQAFFFVCAYCVAPEEKEKKNNYIRSIFRLPTFLCVCLFRAVLLSRCLR